MISSSAAVHSPLLTVCSRVSSEGFARATKNQGRGAMWGARPGVGEEGRRTARVEVVVPALAALLAAAGAHLCRDDDPLLGAKLRDERLELGVLVLGPGPPERLGFGQLPPAVDAVLLAELALGEREAGKFSPADLAVPALELVAQAPVVVVRPALGGKAHRDRRARASAQSGLLLGRATREVLGQLEVRLQTPKKRKFERGPRRRSECEPPVSAYGAPDCSDRRKRACRWA